MENHLILKNNQDIITFGHYPEGDEKQPIQWIVLYRSDNEQFLLSKDILDCKRYHGKTKDIKWRDCVDITWSDCDLRKWLNEEFLHIAFNDREKELIKITHCTNNGDGCPDTEDKVFLLSVDEIKYLSSIYGKDFLKAKGTNFAKMIKPDGCNLYVYDKTNKDNYITEGNEDFGCSWWWLRTQGNKPSRACFIGPDCSIRSYANVSLARDGVRPAVRITIK